MSNNSTSIFSCLIFSISVEHLTKLVIFDDNKNLYRQTKNEIFTLVLFSDAWIVSVKTAPGQSEIEATFDFLSSIAVSAAIRSH